MMCYFIKFINYLCCFMEFFVIVGCVIGLSDQWMVDFGDSLENMLVLGEKIILDVDVILKVGQMILLGLKNWF